MATQPAQPNLDPGALLEAAPEEEFALIELRWTGRRISTEPTFAPQPPCVVGDTPARNDPFCSSGRRYKTCHGA